MTNSNNVRPGMIVRGAGGEKLGKIVQCDADAFIIEKGLFFRKDYVARYDDVFEVKDDEVRLAGNPRQLDDQSSPRRQDDEAERTGTTATADRTEPLAATEARASTISQETRIPVAEEQLEVNKHQEQVGEVQVRKHVVTEQQSVSVPIKREQVVVERVPASGATATPAAQQAELRDRDVTVPVMEEEIEIHKRPVIKEEVRVRKNSYEEQRAASAETRHEEVEVESTGDVIPAPDDPDKRHT